MESASHTEGLVKRFGDLIVPDGTYLRHAGHRWIIVVGLRGWHWTHGLYWALGLYGRKTVRRRMLPSSNGGLSG